MSFEHTRDAIPDVLQSGQGRQNMLRSAREAIGVPPDPCIECYEKESILAKLKRGGLGIKLLKMSKSSTPK